MKRRRAAIFGVLAVMSVLVAGLLIGSNQPPSYGFLANMDRVPIQHVDGRRRDAYPVPHPETQVTYYVGRSTSESVIARLKSEFGEAEPVFPPENPPDTKNQAWIAKDPATKAGILIVVMKETRPQNGRIAMHEHGDPGWTTVAISASKHLRWVRILKLLGL